MMMCQILKYIAFCSNQKIVIQRLLSCVLETLYQSIGTTGYDRCLRCKDILHSKIKVLCCNKNRMVSCRTLTFNEALAVNFCNT